MKLNESKLKWVELSGNQDLAAVRESLRAFDMVAIKLLKEPTNHAARTTLRHHFAKDRLGPQPLERKQVSTKRRGGRLWEHRPKGSALPDLVVGRTCVVPRDSNLLASLGSVRRFIAVAGVSA